MSAILGFIGGVMGAIAIGLSIGRLLGNPKDKEKIKHLKNRIKELEWSTYYNRNANIIEEKIE